MNFFDYELSRTATATPPQTAGEVSNSTEPSLNDEVSQVVGQLGRLWGGFRKQSQVALEAARKDFSSVVAQAQKEIEKLTTDTSAPPASDGAETSASSQEAGPSSSEKTMTAIFPAGDDETTPQPTSPSAESSTLPFQFQTLLSRVQSSLPPNISATLERTIPVALKDPASHAYADIQHLRETLGTEFARVQGVTRAQAEEYVHRSEALLREAGAYLKDAVRVLPPEEVGEATGETDIVFDGMGVGVVVMPPSLRATRSKGKGRETASQAQLRLAGSRAAAMLSQLKRDSEMIKRDPSEDENKKELYEAWFANEVSSKEGSIESPYWVQRTKGALDGEDGSLLRSTRDALVPTTLDSKTFWIRYFFRVYQIEKDEEKRKALLAASGDEVNDDDFNWEDDDDESITPSESVVAHRDASSIVARGSLEAAERSSRDTLQPGGPGTTPASYPESLVTSPSNTSPRESSDGYDVVSSAAGSDDKPKAATGIKNVKDANDTKAKQEAKTDTEKRDDDADSDWE